MPEMDALDTVVDAMRHGRLVRDLASDQVSRTFQPAVDDAKAESRSNANNFFSLGMVMAHSISRRGHSAVLCFSTDNMEKPLLIRLDKKNGRIFLSRAVPAPSQDCPK